VRIGHRLTYLLENSQEARLLVCRTRPLPKQLSQRPALDQLHGEIGTAVTQLTQLIDGHHAGMLELTVYLRLLDETLVPAGVARVLLAQNLDRQIPAQGRIPAAEHLPHAAPANFLVQQVLSGTVNRRLGTTFAGSADRPDIRSRQPGERLLTVQHSLDSAAVLGLQPSLLHENVGDGRIHAARPQPAGLDETARVHEIGLERQDGEQQIAVGVHEGCLGAF
jgi:hypothetical protein